jgi:type II secretory pathway predicted ATPase ExeA
MWQNSPYTTSDASTENRFPESRNDQVSRNLTSDTISSVRVNQDNGIVLKLLDFFGLTQQPFGVTPDPSFLYLSRTHREALASLIYGIENGLGFLALIAKPGMGKTTLLFRLLQNFRSSARSTFLFQTQCTSREFLQFLLSDLGLETNGSQDLVRMHEELNQHLLREVRAGKRFIVLVDEAQNLEPSVLETVRLLSNFETPRAKLLQIVLSGQPELGNKLARHDMVQLQQRVSSLNRLEPFSGVEAQQYIEHRLRLSGYRGGSLLTPDAMDVVTEFSKGIPRNINNLCFNALSLAFASQQRSIDAAMVREVIRDLDMSLHTSQSNEVAREEVDSTYEVSRQSKRSDHDKQAKQIAGSDVSLDRSQPNHSSEEEVSNRLNASLELSGCSHSAKEQPAELSQSLSTLAFEPNPNAKSETRSDLDTLPFEPNSAAKEPKVSLELSGGSHGAKEEPVEMPQSLSQPTPDAKNEGTSDLDALPFEPNSTAKEPKASLELSGCSHSAKEEPVEVSQSLSQPTSNAKNEGTSDLDTSLLEPNSAAKEPKVVHRSPKANSDQPGSDDVLARFSPRTVGGSISLSEAKDYMDSFIRSLKSARS